MTEAGAGSRIPKKAAHNLPQCDRPASENPSNPPGSPGFQPSIPTDGLICLECGRVPDQIQLNRCENRLEHAALVTRGPRGVTTICGGQVVPLDAPWYATFAPGSIARCTLRAPTRTLHRVRLGRPVRLESGSWTGTPLCGLRAKGLWFPIHDAPGASACPACEDEFKRVNTRHERATTSAPNPGA